MKTIALTIMCKNENVDLKENIEYHTLLGIDHFIIYDNNSKHPLKEDLKNYNNVTVHLWKGTQTQAYDDCIKKYKNEYRWIGFIDTDEFILLKNGMMDIKEFLVPYEKYGGLGIQWKCFGSSGHLTRQQSNITSYIHASGTNDDRHIKSIINPRTAKRAKDPHSFQFKNNFRCVNENMKQIKTAFNQPYTRDKIQLNHYVTRSKEDFELKRKRGAADGTSHRFNLQKRLTDEFWERFQNGELDTTLITFREKLIQYSSKK